MSGRRDGVGKLFSLYVSQNLPRKSVARHGDYTISQSACRSRCVFVESNRFYYYCSIVFIYINTHFGCGLWTTPSFSSVEISKRFPRAENLYRQNKSHFQQMLGSHIFSKLNTFGGVLSIQKNSHWSGEIIRWILKSKVVFIYPFSSELNCNKLGYLGSFNIDIQQKCCGTVKKLLNYSPHLRVLLPVRPSISINTADRPIECDIDKLCPQSVCPFETHSNLWADIGAYRCVVDMWVGACDAVCIADWVLELLMICSQQFNGHRA